jgi:predicted RNA binding protein YcfA (HicA-like mRNA interferase family)
MNSVKLRRGEDRCRRSCPPYSDWEEGIGGGVRRLHAIGHDGPVETPGFEPLHRFSCARDRQHQPHQPVVAGNPKAPPFGHFLPGSAQTDAPIVRARASPAGSEFEPSAAAPEETHLLILSSSTVPTLCHLYCGFGSISPSQPRAGASGNQRSAPLPSKASFANSAPASFADRPQAPPRRSGALADPDEVGRPGEDGSSTASRYPSIPAISSPPHEWLASHPGGRALRALIHLGWTIERQRGSHCTLSRSGLPDYVFAFHDNEELGAANVRAHSEAYRPAARRSLAPQRASAG